MINHKLLKREAFKAFLNRSLIIFILIKADFCNFATIYMFSAHKNAEPRFLDPFQQIAAKSLNSHSANDKLDCEKQIAV
jgi:hypothetical protein